MNLSFAQAQLLHFPLLELKFCRLSKFMSHSIWLLRLLTWPWKLVKCEYADFSAWNSPNNQHVLFYIDNSYYCKITTKIFKCADDSGYEKTIDNLAKLQQARLIKHGCGFSSEWIVCYYYWQNRELSHLSFQNVVKKWKRVFSYFTRLVELSLILYYCIIYSL